MFPLVTRQTVGVTVNGDVLVAGQGLVALVAAEVLEVPEVILGARVLGGEDELIARVTTRDLSKRRVITSAKHPSRVEVVKQVHKNLLHA